MIHDHEVEAATSRLEAASAVPTCNRSSETNPLFQGKRGRRAPRCHLQFRHETETLCADAGARENQSHRLVC